MQYNKYLFRVYDFIVWQFGNLISWFVLWKCLVNTFIWGFKPKAYKQGDCFVKNYDSEEFFTLCWLSPSSAGQVVVNKFKICRKLLRSTGYLTLQTHDKGTLTVCSVVAWLWECALWRVLVHLVIEHSKTVPQLPYQLSLSPLTLLFLVVVYTFSGAWQKCLTEFEIQILHASKQWLYSSGAWATSSGDPPWAGGWFLSGEVASLQQHTGHTGWTQSFACDRESYKHRVIKAGRDL